LNLQQDAKGPYDACPYCLTEITVINEPIIHVEPEMLEPETKLKMPESEETMVKGEPEGEEVALIEEKVEVAEPPSECAHYLGYLSEKSSKEQIPDECMMCKDIVSCMLKKMKQ
jgi:hypothetical protein